MTTSLNAILPPRGIARIKSAIIPLLALLLAAGLLCYRGPLRAIRTAPEGSDWSPAYIGARLWVQGANPYDRSAMDKEISKAGLNPARSSSVRPVVYPPQSLPILALLALPRWPAEKVLVPFLMAALLPLCGWSIASAAGFDFRIKILFAAAVLAFGPFQTGIAVLNPSVFAVLSILAAGALWLRDRLILSWMLLGLATAIKPTLGIWFFVAFASQSAWLVILSAGTLNALAMAVALLRMYVAGVHWATAYSANVVGFFGSGTSNDYSYANPQRFNLVQLQVLTFDWAHSRVGADVIAYLMVLLLAAALFISLRASNDRLLALSAISVFALLPVYHRFYDVGVLVLVLAWCFREFHRRTSKLVFVAILPLFASGAALLQASGPSVPGGLSWMWSHIVLPHQLWILLFLCILLILIARSETGSGRHIGEASAEKAGRLASMAAN